MSSQVQRFLHPNGSVRIEIPQQNGRAHGLAREWHPNGVLAAEIPYENGIQHGTTKRWASDGRFLGEFTLDHGTGVAKLWYDNGVLCSETYLLKGVPTGRQKCWDENGEKIGTAYWISGRKVSKRKYLEACDKDPTLPRYEDAVLNQNEAKPSPETRPNNRNVPVTEKEKAIHRRTIEGLLNSSTHEALEWLKGSSSECVRTLGELPTTEASIELVEEGYAAGAEGVIAAEISPPLDGRQNTGKLVIILPKDKQRRQKIFAWSNEQAELIGYDGDPDWGQEHVFVWLD